jgi:MSHA biogenesis protein MshJ
MLKYLKTWQARFDGMSLRERVGIVAAAAVLVYFVLELGLLNPEAARAKALARRIEAQQAELAAVRKEIGAFTELLMHDPNVKEKAQIESMKNSIAQADALIEQLGSNAPQVSAVVKELLAGSSGLTLMSLKTLPVSTMFQSKAAPVAAPAKPAADAKDAAPKPVAPPRPAAAIYRHGIEISVKGNYLALLPYLERLQKYPKPLFWGDASLSVQDYPEGVLNFKVYAMSGRPGSPLQ